MHAHNAPIHLISQQSLLLLPREAKDIQHIEQRFGVQARGSLFPLAQLAFKPNDSRTSRKPKRQMRTSLEETHYLQLDPTLGIDRHPEAGGFHHEQIVGAVADGEDLCEGDVVLRRDGAEEVGFLLGVDYGD